MKFYRPLLIGLIESLSLTLEQNKVSTHVLDTVFKKNKKWGSKDRKAIAEAFYEIIKWQLTLRKILSSEDPLLAERLDFIAVFYLASKGYVFENFVGYSSDDQLLLEDAIHLGHKKPFRAEDFLNQQAGEKWPMNLRFSFPDFWHQKLATENVNTLEFYKNSQHEAPLFVRANLHVNTLQELREQLKSEGYHSKVFNVLPQGVMLAEKANLFKTKAFKDGSFEVQDGGSQQIAPFLQAESGHFVIDACAGGGGKSLHLSNLMENKGRILSMDIHSWKLDELKKRSRRNQCHNIETRLIEGTKTIKRLKDKADRLLLDVPCSGSGVFRRNPDAKYKWNERGFAEICELQKSIINSYSSMVKPGGQMVYSTCSVLASENQNQVQAFLERNPEWFLDTERAIAVGESHFDGYYMARLCRKP